MGIAPNTELYLLKGIPLDSDYTNTIKFESANKQRQFFTANNRVIKHFYDSVDLTTKAMSYIQKDSGVLCVGLTVSQCFNCNYIAFRNSAHEAKWFYAFVTKVEYANEKACYIHYQIDVMQTWMFDYDLGMSFIERQHSPTDIFGENLVPENLETGEYVHEKLDERIYDRMLVGIVSSKDLSGLANRGEVEITVQSPTYGYGASVSGVFNGLYIYTGFVSKADYEYFEQPEIYSQYNLIWAKKTVGGVVGYFPVEASNMIELITGDSNYGEDCIITVFQYPAEFSKKTATTNGKTGTFSAVHEFTVKNKFTYNGATYTPKNNKTLTAPYNIIQVSNNSGTVADFRYEHFKRVGGKCHFILYGCITNPVTVLCYPAEYRGVIDDYDSGVALSNFPICCFKGDAYTRWLVENKNSLVMSTLSSAVTSVVGGASSAAMYSAATTAFTAISGVAGMIGAGIGLVASVGSKLAKIGDMKNTPPQIHGQTTCDALNAGIDRLGFMFYNAQIRPEMARIIDDYFTMYGYATNTVDIPNITSRPHWNFIKTINANILPTSTTCIPSDDLHRIRSVYDHGITFWHNGDEIGDYSLDNSPVSTYTIVEET